MGGLFGGFGGGCGCRDHKKDNNGCDFIWIIILLSCCGGCDFDCCTLILLLLLCGGCCDNKRDDFCGCK